MPSLTHILTLLTLTLSIHVSAQGTQFITGPCTTDTDCASSCCGFNSGKCAGPIIAQERDGGCGFGDAVPNDTAARLLRGEAPTPAPVAPPAATPPPPANSPVAPAPPSVSPVVDQNGGDPNGAGNGAGTQFITGVCSSDADCASACCGFRSGKCAGPIVAQERDGGCGFGDAVPNDDAARAVRGQRLGRRGVVHWARN